MKGAADKLAVEMKQLAAAVFGCSPDDIELAEGHARIKGNPEAALPFMALGAILNANNAGLPADLDITLNVRHVYRPPFEKPDLERKFGNLTLTYATQIHACVVEVDPETGVYEIVDYAAVDDCGKRIHPQIVEGQVHGATAHALGAATHEIFTYDEEGNLLTPNFYDYHVPHALDMPPMKTGYIESESPFTPLGAKGHGGGRRRRHPCRLRRAAERAWHAAARARSSGAAATRTTACGSCCRARTRRASSSAWRADEGRRRAASSTRRVATVWEVLNDPSRMAKTMPGVESFDIQDDRHWRAHVKVPLGLGGLRMSIDFEKTEEREPEFAKLHAKGNGVGAIMNMDTSFHLSDAGRRHEHEVGGRRPHPRPGRVDGPARPAADREPAGVAGAGRPRQAGAGGDAAKAEGS